VIVLKVDAARIHEGEQECLARQLPAVQRVTDNAAGKPDPLEPGTGQQSATVDGLLFKHPVGRPVGLEVNVLQACGQVVKAVCIAGIHVVHGLPVPEILSVTVR